MDQYKKWDTCGRQNHLERQDKVNMETYSESTGSRPPGTGQTEIERGRADMCVNADVCKAFPHCGPYFAHTLTLVSIFQCTALTRIATQCKVCVCKREKRKNVVLFTLQLLNSC